MIARPRGASRAHLIGTLAQREEMRLSPAHLLTTMETTAETLE